MEVPIVEEIVVIFALSIGVLLLCHRMRLPPVVGFLVTGVLCGPHGLGLVPKIDDVQMLATVGIVLLLFTVGMEFSIQKILKYKYYFVGGGLLQVIGTFFIAFLIGKLFYQASWGSAVFLGFLISLSSTAIVLRALDDKGDSDTPHGRLIVGILIFQDIVAVPMMLMIPVLTGSGDGFSFADVGSFLQRVIFLVAIAFAAYKFVPKLLYYVTLTKNRELFLVTVLTVCFAIAWLTSLVGLSLSLGAFLSGLIIAESDYSDEAVGDVMPFQEIFTSFFFVSMGMLLDIGFVIQQPFYILAMTFVTVAVKFFVAAGAAITLGMPLRAAILAGLALGQVGEFSFVLAHSGMGYQLMSEYNYQLFLSISLLTMALTPALMGLSEHVVRLANKLPLPQRIKTGFRYSNDAEKSQKSGHLIITGFGLRGRHLAYAAKKLGMPYTILEMNPETIKQEKKKGEPIHYGDASHRSVLLHAGIKTAKALVVVINEPTATMHIVKAAKSLNPDIYIVTRTRYFQEVNAVFAAGANDVIPDEFGSSLEIFSRVLEKCAISEEVIDNMVEELREAAYETLRLKG
jgi:CPA2 family monovalent cation:H+ antiporter-2